MRSITPGELIKLVYVTIVNDASAESTEQFRILALPEGTTSYPGWLDYGGLPVSILDNDEGMPTGGLTTSFFKVDEAWGWATITVGLDSAPSKNVTVDYSTFNSSSWYLHPPATGVRTER